MGGDGARRKTVGDDEGNVIVARRTRETRARRFIEFAAKIGAQQISSVPVTYAGPAPGFTGLDQVNVMLPSSLAGTGTVNITVSVAGNVSNVVTATF